MCLSPRWYCHLQCAPTILISKKKNCKLQNRFNKIEVKRKFLRKTLLSNDKTKQEQKMTKKNELNNCHEHFMVLCHILFVFFFVFLFLYTHACPVSKHYKILGARGQIDRCICFLCAAFHVFHIDISHTFLPNDRQFNSISIIILPCTFIMCIRYGQNSLSLSLSLCLLAQ